MTQSFVCIFAFFLSILTMPLLAQNEHAQAPPTCIAPEAAQFDFWVGEWDLTWGENLRGTNSVRKLWNACTIEENFTDPNTNLQGKSWSVYDPKKKKWQQTWIDNNGSYMLFEGEFKDGQMLLSRQQSNAQGELQHFKMLFYNIAQNSFDWAWQQSKDNCQTWETLWQIHYQRRLPATQAQDLDAQYLNQQISQGKAYFLVLLNKGKNRKQDKKTSDEIQTKHLQHLFWLKQQGKLDIMGPTTDPKSKLRGIAIYNVANREELINLIESDPAIKTGRLNYEIYEWFGLKGANLGE